MRVFLSLASEAASQAGTLGLPMDASAEGWRIDHILHFTNYAAVTLGGVAMVWLGISLVRDRRHQMTRYTHGTSPGERALPIAIALFVFLVVDGYLLFRSSTDLHTSILRVDDALEQPDALRVQIGARQWGWDVRYPGSDGAFDTGDDIYTVSKLVVPKGRAVVFELSSGDVVHSFYLPNFRIKQDAIPAALVRGWFKPAMVGRYEIACAQHCGVHHYQMRGYVEVVEEADYQAWQLAMSLDALRLSTEDLRTLAEEPSRGVVEGEPAPTRDWAWPWGEMK